jgi:outer membrane usher protein
MPRRLVVALLCVAIAVVAGAGHATVSRDERAVLELTVNGVPRGDVIVVLRGDDVLVPVERLRDAGLVRLTAPSEMLQGSRYVSLRAASSSITFEMDEEALTLALVAAPSVLKETTIDLSASAPKDMRYEYDPSLFFNYAPRLIDGREFQTFGETGLSVGNLVAETAATYGPSEGATRLGTSVSFDDRANLRTASFGDKFISTGPLGGGTMFGGISLARNYALDPYLIKIPRLGYTGETTAPATVDVYVNDVLVRRVPVNPGRFELTNITPVSGAGTTRYVLRDAYGRQRRLESTYYASRGTLAAGLSEYDYGVGFTREHFGTRSWSYGEPMLAATHRFGVSKHLTVGYHAEFQRTRGNAGTELLVAGKAGELEVESASSSTMGTDPLRGGAALLGYSYRWPRGSVRIVAKATSRDYSTLTLDPEDDRALVEHVAATGLALGSNVSLATNVAYSWLRDSGPGLQLGVTLSARLSKTVGLQIRSTRARAWLSRWENDVFATLSWSLPENHSAQLIGHTGTTQSDATARVARSLQERTDIGYEVSGSLGDSHRAAGVVRGQSRFGRATATYTNEGGDQHTLVEAAGGIVAVDGDVYFTVPVRQSFAVLEIPRVSGARGYLDNREVGTTDGSGRLFVPGLRAYEANRLRIDQSDLPLDHGLEEVEVVLAPPTRGGAVVRFPSREMRLVRGRLLENVDGGHSPVDGGTLRARVNKRVYVSPVGVDGEFELDNVPQGSWRALVRSERGVCVATLTIASSDELIQDLGTVACLPPRKKATRP